MKKNLEAQHKELEEKRRVFEEERANWEALQRMEQQKLEASRYMLHSDAMLWIREQHNVVLEQQTCQLFVRFSWT